MPQRANSRARRAVERVRGGLALLYAIAAAPLALAQLPPAVRPPVDQLQRPSEVPLPAPELKPPPKAPEIAVPPFKPAPEAPVLSQGARVLVRAFRFTGNTVVTESELQSLTAPYLGRELGSAELENIRQLITRRYVDAGYINSGAVIPDQDVTSGVIAFQIIEGRLSEIIVGGNNRFRPGYLRERIALGAEPVLNVNRLQERMQILLQDPQIERLSAELAPGTQRGDATLRADVTGTPPFFAGITLSNDRSPVVGADQAELLFGTRNLLGLGESLTLRTAQTSGIEEYFAGFALPLTARGLVLQTRYQHTRSHVVEAPFDQLDISADSESWELALSQPLIEHPQRWLVANATLARRSTQSFFLGQPSPFIPGTPDGRFTTSVLRLGLDWVNRTMERVLAARTQVSIGLDAFGSSVGDFFPDSRFTSLLGQFQWVQRAFSPDGQLVLRAEAQYASDMLPNMEKYSLGGMDSVRGYRKDLFVRDNGIFASAEYRHTVGHLALRPGAPAGEGAIRAAIFFDAGRAQDHGGPATHPRYIASIGPGVRWEAMPGFEAVVYYGHALKDVNTVTTTSQDRGWHIRVGYNKAF